MDFTANSQQSPEKSTTMWSQPKTEEQKKYYSKHAPKRRVYGVFMAMLQTGHGFLAFAAWTAIYSWGLDKMPNLLFLAPFLAAGSLVVLHMLFRVTWDTFWYDRLDDDPNTDSSIWIPLAIIVVLGATEIFGAMKFLRNQVDPPKVENIVGIDSSHTNTVASIDKRYETGATEITRLFKTKKDAATLPFDRKIRSMRNRRADTPEERRYVANQVAILEAQRDAALAPVLTAESEAMAANLAEANNARTFENTRRSQAVSAIDTRNQNEQSRFQDEMGSIGTYAWLISLALITLIAALGYGRVRINVMSGILPLRNYTVLDAHGSALERLSTAISDAFNRRSLQLAVWIHKILSPSKEISSFDGTVVSKPGTYNTPKGLFPTPPATKPIDQAIVEVSQKIEAIKKSNPGFTPTPGDYAREIDLALTNNGSYPGMPFQGDVGKASTPPVAEARPGGVIAAAPYAGTEACQTVSDRLSEYEPGKTPSMPLLIANIDKWVARARQCWRRAHPDNTEVKSPEKQYENQNKAEKYAAVINCFGYTVEWKNGPHPSDHEVVFKNLNWTDEQIRANVEKNWAPMYNTLEYLGEIKTAKQPAELL